MKNIKNYYINIEYSDKAFMNYKVGDRVFDPRFGYGIITEIKNEKFTYRINVEFNHDINYDYTIDGRPFITAEPCLYKLRETKINSNLAR